MAPSAAAEPVQPKLTYRPQHKLEVFYTGGAAKLTKDGKHVVCACNDDVKIVDVATGGVVRTLTGDSEPITAIAVSPDCRTLVVASRSLACRVYDLTTGTLKRTWKPHKAPVSDMTIDASGGFVATASADRSIKVWDLAGGFVTHNLAGHSGVVLKVLFHPKQLMLFSAGDDAEVRVWDLVTKSCTALLKAHFSAVTSLALSPDGWLLLSGGRDKVVVLWDLRTSKNLATIPVYEAVEGLVALPLGCTFPGVAAAASAVQGGHGAQKAILFATAGDKGLVRLWRSDTAAMLYSTPQDAAVASAASEFVNLSLLPGGGGLMAATADARLLFYHPEAEPASDSAEAAAAAVITTPSAATPAATQLAMRKQLIGNIDEVTDLRFIGPPAEPTHIAVATNSETVRLYALSTLSCTSSFVGHKDIVLCLDAAYTNTGLCLAATGAKDNDVRVWDGLSGRCVGTGVGHIGAVGAVAFSHKGAVPKFLVSAGADKLLKIWDIAPALTAAASGSAAVALLATAAVSAHDKDINSVAVAPNDSLIATASQDRTVKLWRPPSLIPVRTLRGHRRGVWSVQFSPVDQALITSSGDKTIKLWSIVDGSCLRTFEGHTASVLRASFATVGTQVLSVGADGLLKLWGVSSGECVATFDEHADKVWALTSAGTHESMLATGGSDALVTIWANVTAADAAAADAAEEQLVEREQALANALADEDYTTAAQLAFTLKHPGRLLDAINRATSASTATVTRIGSSSLASATSRPLSAGISSRQGGASGASDSMDIGDQDVADDADDGEDADDDVADAVVLSGAAAAAALAAHNAQHAAQQAAQQKQQHKLLASLVRAMSPTDLRTALEYVREWNTHAKHCHSAHAMLAAILRQHKPADLLDVSGVSDLLDALEVYSARHYSRVDRLLRSSFLLDYTLGSMHVLSPTAAIAAEEHVAAAARTPAVTTADAAFAQGTAPGARGQTTAVSAAVATEDSLAANKQRRLDGQATVAQARTEAAAAATASPANATVSAAGGSSRNTPAHLPHVNGHAGANGRMNGYPSHAGGGDDLDDDFELSSDLSAFDSSDDDDGGTVSNGRAGHSYQHANGVANGGSGLHMSDVDDSSGEEEDDAGGTAHGHSAQGHDQHGAQQRLAGGGSRGSAAHISMAEGLRLGHGAHASGYMGPRVADTEVDVPDGSIDSESEAGDSENSGGQEEADGEPAVPPRSEEEEDAGRVSSASHASNVNRVGSGSRHTSHNTPGSQQARTTPSAGRPSTTRVTLTPQGAAGSVARQRHPPGIGRRQPAAASAAGTAPPGVNARRASTGGVAGADRGAKARRNSSAALSQKPLQRTPKKRRDGSDA